MNDGQVLPSPSLVVLVGPPASGKSTWAHTHFNDAQILSADSLRGIVGEHELDLAATEDAFTVLDQLLEMRLGRGLTTVIDTTGLDDARRLSYHEAARRHKVFAAVVRFDTPATDCKARNRSRLHPVPARALDTMLKRFAVVSPTLDGEGWDRVLTPAPVRTVSKKLASVTGMASAPATQTPPTTLRFGLLVSNVEQLAQPANVAPALLDVAHNAERAGFDSIWFMDHLIQIPQVGREWDMLLEPYTTLAFLAAHTRRIRLGVLVSPATFRHPAVLAKLVATLDVLSGGRAVAGLGAGSFEHEHAMLDLAFGQAAERLDRVEEVAGALRTFWASGAKPIAGQTWSIERAVSYPRPLQEPMPLIIGGSGERRTLEIAARLGTGCNIFGTLPDIERRIGIVSEHLAASDKDRSSFEITHLGDALLAADASELRALIEEERPANLGPQRFADRTNAGTISDHEVRYREMARLGVDTAIVSTRRLTAQATFDAWADLIGRFHASPE